MLLQIYFKSKIFCLWQSRSAVKSSWLLLLLLLLFCGHSGRNNELHPSLSAGSFMTNGRYVVSTYLIYITCIMYSIWDISFSGLAVSPNTHGDQHISWGCNNPRNTAVMGELEEVTWHNDVPTHHCSVVILPNQFALL